MAKSRVEKNKSLYEELELESFELEDISETKIEDKVEEVKEVVKKQEIVPVSKKEKHAVVKVEKTKSIEDDDFVVEQPISYTSKLSVEEILRAKLEKQQQLKSNKKNFKKSPVTETYTPEMMQKNINQREGVDIRKEANIRVKNSSNSSIAFLILLLILIVAGGVIAAYFIW